MAFNKDKCMKIVAEEDLTFEFDDFYASGVSIPLFSKTGEEGTWVAKSIELNAGESAFVKGNGPTSKSRDNFASFTSTGKYHIEGQITSLLNNGEGGDVPLTQQHCFGQLFAGNRNLTGISENFLPSTTLSPYCYYELFQYCEELQTPNAIILPADPVDGCYENMFYAARKVNKLKVLASGWIAGCASQWLYGCPAEGTFYCYKSFPDVRSGDGGIPVKWTRINLKEHEAGSVTFLNKVKAGGRVI